MGSSSDSRPPPASAALAPGQPRGQTTKSPLDGKSLISKIVGSLSARRRPAGFPEGGLGDAGRDGLGHEAGHEPGLAPVATQPGLANLRRMRVDDVAIPKAEIVAIPADITKEALVEVFRQHGFSRLPVYKGSLDHPLGLILLKDFALQHGFGTGPSRFALKKLIRPVIFAPPSMPASTLLQKMQRERAHMALVIDEYGGVDGLVTIEDLIETIIGEIDDEHDEAARSLWRQEGPGSYVVQAMADLEDFEKAIGLALREDEDDDELDTLGGLVFARKGRVPKRGEIVTLANGVQFTVLEADARRIKRLRVRLPEAVAAADAALQGAKADPAPGPGGTAAK